MSRPVVLSDFDGTITIKDTNNTLFSYFNKGDSKKIFSHYNQNQLKLGIRWLLAEQYKQLNITRQEMKKFVEEHIPLEPTFLDFLRYIHDKDFVFAVLSGGFKDYIEVLLHRHDIEIDFPIHANRLVFPDDEGAINDYITAEFVHSPREAVSEFGPAPTPKGKIIEEYQRQGSPVFYLGDGRTDRHAVGRADYILTKLDSFLQRYCEENDYDHHVFADFNEAKQIIQAKL
ncbi:MAG: HAD-IB family phosphatase [Bacillota bacterium]